MMKRRPIVKLCVITIAAIIIKSHLVAADVGESAAVTLAFPPSARTSGMGEVGTALADDEACLFYNPAGLGVPNRKFNYGLLQPNFFEPLLPAFGIHDLWHYNLATCFQTPLSDRYGLGLNFNYINMGENVWTNELGQEIGRAHSYEWVGSISWGFNFRKFGIDNHSWGLSLKYVYSALAPGIGSGDDGIGRTYAIDFGYLWCILPTTRFGLTFANMGPAISYYSDSSYATKDPLPFTINLALAYLDTYHWGTDLDILSIKAETRLSRELVHRTNGKPDPFYKAIGNDINSHSFKSNINQIQVNYGMELTVFNTGSLRWGTMLDLMGERYERHIGFGLNILNHFRFDYSYIIAPEGYMKSTAQSLNPSSLGSTGARDGQYSFSLTFTSMGDWQEGDFQWWKGASNSTPKAKQPPSSGDGELEISD